MTCEGWPMDTTNNKRYSPPLELKFDATATASGKVKGYASTFGGVPDSHGDIIQAGAFARTIAEHQAAGFMPMMLWAHDQSRVVGRWLTMKEDSYGLAVEGVFNLQTQEGSNAHAHVKAGDVTGMSIGYLIAPNGKQFGPQGTTILTDLDLVEISVVGLPANRRARITLDSKRDLVDLLHKHGLPKVAAERLANGGWPALQAEPSEDTSTNVKEAAARIVRLAQSMRQK
ncbi:HK97 family phage prohead protease [Xanthobacter sp. DSM 24535]|uniref:HK97 family phage prohead protease n=1 Tax=Roseixanthobacter psychrophilus TaxID=3119917 RepID=UPI003728FE96